MAFLMNLYFLYLMRQFTLMKYAPRKYSIFLRQELQNFELTRQLTMLSKCENTFTSTSSSMN